ncbi:glycoside hydrolase superfamily [Chlamydoabsidia padenii]|nr:glycoside hydrolase superfamily [Chlamydoabsidia padenii]
MIPLSDTLKQHEALIKLKYAIRNQHFLLKSTFNGLSVSDYYLTVQRKFIHISHDSFEIEYTIQLNNEEGASLVKLEQFDISFGTELKNTSMFAEGFQAWSHTKEHDKNGGIPGIQSTVAWITKFDLQGDYNFYKYSGKQGAIHSTGYTYLRDNKDDSILFLGSLSEHNGYSYFKGNFDSHRFSIYKDVEGKTLSAKDTFKFGFLVTQHHDQKTLWRRYADRLFPTTNGGSYSDVTISPRPLTGWTSWYNFYEAVTEKDVIDSISGFVAHDYPVDLIQIDDGFETAIGDWLDVDSVKFPRGMKFLADEIKQRTNDKAIPGIWLAPFAVGLKSKLIKDHPDWLVYCSDGTPLLAGPNWGGFRALDIYHPEVRDYLQNVFDTVIDDWGYKFLKLDFIFAAAMIPRHGKSRGEIMWDAVTLINELVRKRALLLGSGVTLPSSWGRMDYSRISSDASPWWDHSILRIANVRERVSTYNALVSTLNRWPMNNVMFGNDPDVFFIRSNNNKLTPDERYTLLVTNNLLGQMALMSDNVSLYSTEEHDLYSKTFPKVQVTMDCMDRLAPDVYRLQYICNKRPYITVINISSTSYRFLLPTTNKDTIYFEYENPLIKSNNDRSTPLTQWIDAKDGHQMLLRSHQTRTFMRIVDEFAGSTGHIVPGWELESIDNKGDDNDLIFIKLRHPRVQKRDIHFYFRIPTNKINTEDNNDGYYSKTFINDKKPSTIQLLTPSKHNKTASFPVVHLVYHP